MNQAKPTYHYCSSCNKDRACIKCTKGTNSEIYYQGRLIKCSAGQKWENAPRKKQSRCDGWHCNNSTVPIEDIYPEHYMHGCDVLCKACENRAAWADMQEWIAQQQYT